MQADLATEYGLVQEVYAQASDVLGYDLWQLVQDGPPEKLAETVITQPAMLTAGYAAWRIWQECGGAKPSHMAGHSLGEYTALVCAGAVSFGDALKVVKKRSELMQAAVPVGVGAMAGGSSGHWLLAPMAPAVWRRSVERGAVAEDAGVGGGGGRAGAPVLR